MRNSQKLNSAAKFAMTFLFALCFFGFAQNSHAADVVKAAGAAGVPTAKADAPPPLVPPAVKTDATKPAEAVSPKVPPEEPAFMTVPVESKADPKKAPAQNASATPDDGKEKVELHNRYVYMQFPSFTLRLKVSPTLSDAEFARIDHSIKGACVIDLDEPSDCHSTIEIAPAELERLKTAAAVVEKKSEGSLTEDTTRSLGLRLTCKADQPDCLEKGGSQRHFMISAESEVPLHDIAGNADLIHYRNVSHRAPASITGITIRRCYVTVDQSI
jgi:hypothetical protein